MTAPTYPDDDARWNALRAKDRAAQGAFYIGVRTTGIYCVASCGGRPLRKNVDFHATREAARAAGLRACLRCKPDLDRETLRWGVVETSLGLALIARSDAGLRLVALGDDIDSLRSDLETRFKQARLIPDTAGLAADLAAVATLVDHPQQRPDLPLDDLGTDLQKAVWAALRQIPSGRTVSYADIAHAIGQPKAFRAVAQACGANPLAVITPCHRVVRSDGGLSGYRWGLARKRALLAREAA